MPFDEKEDVINKRIEQIINNRIISIFNYFQFKYKSIEKIIYYRKDVG